MNVVGRRNIGNKSVAKSPEQWRLALNETSNGPTLQGQIRSRYEYGQSISVTFADRI